MPSQKSNAGNQGDVMKHPPLHKVVQHRATSNGKDEFWYVETHAGYPYYFLSPQGSWQEGIDHLDRNCATAPPLLTDYARVAYHDKHNVHVRFPDKRVYLGSAAQVFDLLKVKKKRVRMTLFELDAGPAHALFEYFQNQGAKALLVTVGGDGGHAVGSLRQWWDVAVAKTQEDDLVMVVQGDSYSLAPALWAAGLNVNPDLIFVDPFKIGDSIGQPAQLLSSLDAVGVPFTCWTPLSCVPNQWPQEMWSFEDKGNRTGNQNAQRFVRDCFVRRYQLAWFSWRPTAGSTREMYGCQLAFGHVFNQQFSLSSIWQFAAGNGVPYIDLSNQVANQPQQVPNFQNLTTYWRTPGQALNSSPPPIQAQAMSGVPWWDKYHITFWWP